jgi:Spy/CpxP family protein refolding chaperone
MKKMLFALLLAVSTCTLSFAQQPQSTPPQKTTTTKTSKAKQLGLTKDQQDKIKATNKEAKAKKAAIKADNSLTESQKKAKVKAVNKDHKEKLDKVYTPEQKAKMKDMKAQKKATTAQKKKTAPKPAATPKA